MALGTTAHRTSSKQPAGPPWRLLTPIALGVVIWAPIVAALFVVGVSVLQMVVIVAIAWATLAAVGFVRGSQAAKRPAGVVQAQRTTVPWEVATLRVRIEERPAARRRRRFRHHPDGDPLVEQPRSRAG